MKKLIILLTLMVMVTGVVGAADFRDVNWGMTRDEVISREGTPDYNQGNMVAYEVELFDTTFALGFMFYENTLTNARYMLMGDPVGTEYKQLIEDLNEGLTKKYGEPDGRGIVWLDDYYKHKPSKFHIAVKSGEVIAQYEYEGDTTEVLLGVMGQGYEDQFFVMYEPKNPKYKRMIEQREKEKKGKSESQL